MPKILPFFGALLTIAGAIGWNTVRYPVVWEMVGPAADFPLSASGEPSAIAAQPAQTEQAHSAGQAPPKTNPELPIVAVKPPPINPPVATPVTPVTIEEKQPLVVIPASQYAASRGAGCQPAYQNEAAGGAGSQPAPRSEIAMVSSALVRRLPPLDAEVPPPRSSNTAAYPPGAIPLYPHTGY